MSSEYLDITPEPHYLESVRADKGSWSELLAEAVDNSLDADADQVAIDLLPDTVTIEDNGRGITRDREDAIVKLGAHRPMPNTKLGRFGIGIKYNAISAGQHFFVESTSRDGRMTLAVDWPQVIRSKRWQIPRPHWSVIRPPGTGTIIEISRLRWKRPQEKDVQAAREHLSHIFYPAIQSGATIRMNGQHLQLLQEPLMTDVVEQTVQLPNGKGAHVRGGMLVESGPLYQVQVSYKHRVIKSKSTFGCKDFTGTRRMFARVTLTADWGLTRFKDDLEDPDDEQLEEAVFAILEPVLDKCRKASWNLKVDELTEAINDLLPKEIRPARPTRTSEKRGGLRPKRPSRQNGRVKDDTPDDGPARKDKASDTLKVTFDGPLCDEHGYGVFEKGRPNRITLATDNPIIKSLMTLRDQSMAVQSLYSIALFLYHEAKDSEPGQKRLPLDDSSASFGLRVWRTAALQPRMTENQAAGNI